MPEEQIPTLVPDSKNEIIEEIADAPIAPEVPAETPLSEPVPEVIIDNKNEISEEEPTAAVTAKKAPAPEPTTQPEVPPVIIDNKDLISENISPRVPVETPPLPLPPSPSKSGISQKVLDLTPEELDVARRLWAREHLADAQKKANESRHARMMSRMAEIEKFIKANPNCSVHEVANRIHLSEKLTSGYLQKLVHARRVEADGSTRDRRYRV